MPGVRVTHPSRSTATWSTPSPRVISAASGPVVVTSYDDAAAPCPHRPRGALRDQPALTHDPRRGSTSAPPPTAGGWTPGPSPRRRPGMATRWRTSRVPCGSSPFVGSSRIRQVAGRPGARRRFADPLPHAQRVCAVALASGRRAQPHPVERGVDPLSGGAGVGGTLSAESNRARFCLPDRYGWNAGPSTSAAHPGQDRPPHRRAWARRAARSPRRSGGRGRAACGSSWSCPTRWGRGTRTPRRQARRGRWRRRLSASRSAWSAPRWRRPRRGRRTGPHPPAPGRACRIPGRRSCRHWAARTAPSVSGLTAPSAIRPSSVRIAENSVPRSTLPVPPRPGLGRQCLDQRQGGSGAGCITVTAVALLAARRAHPDLGEVGERVGRQFGDHNRAPGLTHDRGFGAGRRRAVDGSEPRSPAAAGAACSVTVAPGGGVNSNSDGSGWSSPRR